MPKLPSNESIAIYKYFKSLPGSEHIGKPVSIDALINICKQTNPKRVLEMGGGIGALSYTLLRHSNAFVDIYEDNEYCREELKKNLKQFEGRFQIIDTYRLLPPAQDYDIAVIDGGNGLVGDGGYDMAAHLFLLYLNSIKVVYIEGYRGMQKDMVRRALQKNYVCTFKVHKQIFIEGKKWVGGLEVHCNHAKSAITRWALFLFWELVVLVRTYYFKARSIIK